jgi:NAD+ kinase
MFLQYQLQRADGEHLRGEAIKDVVLMHGQIARLCNLRLTVDGKPFVVLRSDGLIFSTPVGSFSYSVSAGGPLLGPSLLAYTVTAICPYQTRFYPLTLCPETRFSVHIEEPSTEIFLSADGQESIHVADGDVLEVYCSVDRMLTTDFGQTAYLERLMRRCSPHWTPTKEESGTG